MTAAATSRPSQRSLLFVPASTPARVDKAVASGADGVIVDLEDAVAVSEKESARATVVDLLARARPTAVFVRVNALSTPFCLDDIEAAAGCAIDGIVLPKVEAAADLLTADWLLRQFERRCGKAEGTVEVLPLIETAQGIAAAAAIATASPRVRRLGFGAVDLALDMDLRVDDEDGAMAHARFALALASRAAGLEGPLDTVFTDIRDEAGLRRSAERARAMGFGGKACIHPSQVATVNAAFSPGEAEIARARAIVEAFERAEAAGSAAVVVGGAMVDYPVVVQARRLLAAVRVRGG